jgi:uncharacterized repeat protein (TIGR01451 family)
MKIFTKTKALIALFVLAILGTTSVFIASSPIKAAEDVPIESKLEVGNATQGVGPAKSVNARVDDVVNITVWYHNIELPDSGRIAENVNVRIAIPGVKTQTHQVTSRVAGTNTNVVNDLATVNTSIASNLTYIPGTATRRYNAGTNESPNWVIAGIPDTVVSTGYNVPQLRPCWNFQESINVQARVTAALISITTQVKLEGTDGWVTSMNADEGANLAFLISIKNEGNERLTNVIVRDSLPAGMEFVPGSARLTNANYPNGYTLSDGLVGAGVNIGNYGVGSNAYIRFNATIDDDLNQCGAYRFVNVAAVRSDQLGEYYNTAVVSTNNICVTSESGLMIVKFHDRDGDRTEDSNEERLSGWRFRVVGNDVDTILTTDSNGIARLNDIEAGSYTVTEILTEGWTNTTGLSIQRNVPDNTISVFTFGNRMVTPPVTPPGGGEVTLPKSGPAETAAMAFGTMSFSGAAAAWIRSKKRLLGSFRK